MKLIEIRQPFKDLFNDDRTDVYINDYGDQRKLRKWCIENFGDYRLDYSRKELNEPEGLTIFIFQNFEHAFAFILQWSE